MGGGVVHSDEEKDRETGAGGRPCGRGPLDPKERQSFLFFGDTNPECRAVWRLRPGGRSSENSGTGSVDILRRSISVETARIAMTDRPPHRARYSMDALDEPNKGHRRPGYP